MDTFPEAFNRLEIPELVRKRRISDYEKLRQLTVDRFGDGWVNSAKQNQALRSEAEKLNINPYGSVQAIQEELGIVNLPVKGTYSQFYRITYVTRNGKRYKVARDNKGRFARQVKIK